MKVKERSWFRHPKQSRGRYEELISDLKRTNTELNKLADELLRIARATKRETTSPHKVLPKAPSLESTSEEQPTVDYRIEPNGTVVSIQSVRATQRGGGPRPQRGSRLAFKARHDVMEFVLAGEATGFTFEGKEFLDGNQIST
jgi:hypothetical protein